MEETQVKAGTRILTVRLGGERYGLPIDQVEAIVPWTPLTQIPDMPPFAAGVVNVRGAVIPVIDMRVRVGLPRPTDDSGSRIIVMNLDGTKTGLLVDAVDQVVWVPFESIEAQVPMVVDKAQPIVSGVARMTDGLAVMLDEHRLVPENKLALLHDIEHISANATTCG